MMALMEHHKPRVHSGPGKLIVVNAEFSSLFASIILAINNRYKLRQIEKLSLIELPPIYLILTGLIYVEINGNSPIVSY